jgi:hypothetical protein
LEYFFFKANFNSSSKRKKDRKYDFGSLIESLRSGIKGGQPSGKSLRQETAEMLKNDGLEFEDFFGKNQSSKQEGSRKKFLD